MIRQCLAMLACLTCLGLLGCGGGLPATEGVVTLDGTPVDGATILFVPASGSGKEATGSSDTNGKFTLKTGNKNGAAPGDYKVMVTKTKAVVGMENIKPGSPEFAKAMQEKMGKGGGMPPAGGGVAGPGAQAGPKSELPAVYAGQGTPLKATIPHSGPIKLELSSKAK